MVAAVIRDVAARRQAVAALVGSEARYRSLFEHSLDAVLLTAPDGRILAANPAACRMFGYTEAELCALGRPAVVDVTDPRLAELSAERDRTGRAIGALRLRRKDGTILHGEVSSAIFFGSDGSPRTSMVIRDVTERKEAEARLHLLAAAAQLFAMSVDYQATLQAVSRLALPDFAEWCMVDLLTADGRFDRVALAAPSAGKEALLHRIHRAYPPHLSGPHPAAVAVRSGQVDLRRDLGPAYWASIAQDDAHLALLLQLGTRSRMSAPLIARGRTLGAVSLCRATRNYTEADVVTAELLVARMALAIENARLYAAEQTARQEAEAAAALRNEMLTALSHDLKNPLTAIKGMAQHLRRRTARLGAPEAKELVENTATIEAAAGRTLRLLEGIVDSGRLQAGQPLDLRRRPTDIVALVQELVAAQRAAHPARQIDVAAPSRLTGRWDTARLERVFDNLLSNALKYSRARDGRITVTVSEEPGEDGSWAIITVVDRGVGIPDAELPRISERFYRASNVRDRIAGTGLGLTGARRLVEQHGGTLLVTSTDGTGTTVTVRLPRDVPGRKDR